MWKKDPIMQALTSVLCLHYRPDSTLQYKRCVHLWNNFPCITTSVLMMNSELPVLFLTYRIYNFCLFDSFLDQTFFRTRAVISKISNTSWRNRRGVAREKNENRFFFALVIPRLSISVHKNYQLIGSSQREHINKCLVLLFR